MGKNFLLLKWGEKTKELQMIKEHVNTPGDHIIENVSKKKMSLNENCKQKNWVSLKRANSIIFFAQLFLYFFSVLVREVKERKVEKIKKSGWKIT